MLLKVVQKVRFQLDLFELAFIQAATFLLCLKEGAHMSKTLDPRITSLRRRLEQEREDIRERIQSGERYGLSQSMRDWTGELSPIDNHPADMASEMYEREKDQTLLEREHLHLERIEAALAAMDRKSYGLCAACGEPIPAERLEAMPDSLYCVRHAAMLEAHAPDIAPTGDLSPAMGRAGIDRPEHSLPQNEFSWQTVEKWGNSDSPAMSQHREVDNYDDLGGDDEELAGCVEAMESFLATDITGRHVTIVRNSHYDDYMHSNEGDHTLED